uniref:CCHC-type domain-containing protein n=1 Tax=Suricata suricatta TaxID=37032 RepID=A0A673V210_SURSU
MGKSASKPLDLVLLHFKEVRVRAHSLSPGVEMGKMTMFCTSKWPASESGWPPKGTFHLPIIEAIEERVYQRMGGHPGQIPYIVVWKDLVPNPPIWVKPFLPPVSPQVLVARTPEEEKPRRTMTSPSASPYPVLQEGADEDLLFPPPPYRPPLNPSEPAPSPSIEGGPAYGTRSRRGTTPDSTVFPLRAMGPIDEAGNQPHHYWPFASSDLYNWRSQTSPYSENPKGLIGLLETVLFTHQPTWDDCQQLLQVLFTTEEREWILLEARKLVPGPTGVPTMNPADIDAGFPLVRPNWDYNPGEGEEHLKVYRQALLAGVKAAARRPTNLTRVYDIRQEADESPAAFLERVMEAFRQFTPFGPEHADHKSTVVMAFINQATPDIKKKLQKVERLGEKTLRDLVETAERVYNNRDSAEEKQVKAEKRQNRDLARVLLALTANPEDRHHQLKKIAGRRGQGRDPERRRTPIGKNQCTCCKEEGHWLRACPRRKSFAGEDSD